MSNADFVRLSDAVLCGSNCRQTLRLRMKTRNALLPVVALSQLDCRKYKTTSRCTVAGGLEAEGLGSVHLALPSWRRTAPAAQPSKPFEYDCALCAAKCKVLLPEGVAG